METHETKVTIDIDYNVWVGETFDKNLLKSLKESVANIFLCFCKSHKNSVFDPKIEGVDMSFVSHNGDAQHFAETLVKELSSDTSIIEASVYFTEKKKVLTKKFS
jgi:hypothetical protein